MSKPTSRQYAAARILTVDWLASLSHSIESRRARLVGRAQFVASDTLALITAHVVTKPRRGNKAPSPLTFADEVAQATDTKRSNGALLLHCAEAAGFVVLADAEGNRSGWRAAKEVRLSIAADAQRAQIEARLAASEVPDARPLLGRPALEVRVTPNYDDKDPPPLPIGHAVAEALAPIQGTAWRVNQFILDTLRKLAVEPRDIAALEQAARYRDAPELFYRCNFDWRGRLYQQGGRLQYTSGTDAARALLEFAHGEPLTSEGYNFLGVHVATCYGIRGSFADRMVWTVKFSDRIAKAAADPVGFTWWRKAKQPYRFLAACRAWADVAANPRAPVHLPVTADATASAFQHYAWLLRDEALGRRVNLEPGGIGARPRDFYGNLAKRTPYSRDEIKAWAWMFYGKNPDPRKLKAVELRRAHAVQALLKAQAPRAWRLYLTLRRAAKRQAQEGGALEWTLPDGFKVRQANRVAWTRKVELWVRPSHKGGKPWSVQARERDLKDALDTNAQARGLPPNLIHSLDACLLRTVVREAGTVTRWAVAHDSLGVHPNDGGRLRGAIVEAIECIYRPDLLAGLLEVLRCDDVEHVADLPVTMRGGWYTFS